MYSSAGSASAQQVPAWKRLGLKLKQPDSASSGSAASESRPTGGVGHPSSRHEPSPGKRKLDAPPAASASSQVAKRPRKDEASSFSTPDRNPQGQLRRQKSVTFADTPTKYSVDAKTSKTAPPPPNSKSKGPAKKNKTPPNTTDLKPALEYLRLWKSARDSWKFNKNNQSALIKHVFDADGIPATDIDTFYDYIQDLKGFIRMRLRETALEIRTKDQSEGQAGFPEGTKDVEATQGRYETVLARFLTQQAGQKRKGFVESEYLADSEDGELIIRRLVKRLRAELILEELSESGESGLTERSTTSSSSETIAASDNHATTTTDAEKKIRLNDGSSKRRRKLRTANADDSSSSSESEAESDSDSDSSSSGSSSSDESSDDDVAEAAQGDGYGTSSSSSSSSSSESGSDDESDDDESDSD